MKYLLPAAAFILCLLPFAPTPARAEKGRSGQVVFASADEALLELRKTLKAEDSARMVELFGKPSQTIFITGDVAADALALWRLSRKFDQRAEFFPVLSEEFRNEQWYLIRYAIEGWNMHVPLVNRGKGWNFATEYATDADLRARELLNEVVAVDTLLALVKAQEQYKSEGVMGTE